MNKRKVFCTGCRFLTYSTILCVCYHPKTRIKTPDTWFEPGEKTYGDPRKINANNDCPYREKK